MGGYDGIERHNTVERYDVKENYWTQVADMNDVRSDASAAVACGRIYVTGGFTGRAVLDTIEYYDPSTDLWTRVKSLPWKRSGHKMLAHNDIIYIIGGFNGTTRVSRKTVVQLVEKYDIAARKWCAAAQISDKCSAAAACVVQDVVNTGTHRLSHTWSWTLRCTLHDPQARRSPRRNVGRVWSTCHKRREDSRNQSDE
ncbi:hypothetical protein MTO96_031790 [Rhipicephalus appendiculatus]